MFEIAMVQEYISPIALVICLAVGYVVKNLVPNEKVNRFIPLLVAALGVLICAWSALAVTPEVLCQGLISGLASTGLYEAFKNTLNVGGNQDANFADAIGGTDE